MKDNYLFVYGTLLKDFDSPVRLHFERYAEFVDKAFIYGQLFEVQNYPAAVESKDTSLRIYGELYRLHDTQIIFGILDDYEGCGKNNIQPHEYQRVITKSVLSNLTAQETWVYFYNLPVLRLLPIPHGDYRRFIHEKNKDT